MDRKTHRGESREWTGRLIVEKVENGQEDSSWRKQRMDRKTHRWKVENGQEDSSLESREWTGRLIVEKVENGQEDSSWRK